MILDMLGNVIDSLQESFNDMRQMVDIRGEWLYQEVMDELSERHTQHPSELRNIQLSDDDRYWQNYGEAQTRALIESLQDLAPGTPGSLVYNVDGDCIGGYNYEGEYCSIGNLVL